MGCSYYSGINEIKHHPFFEGIDFEKISNKKHQLTIPHKHLLDEYFDINLRAFHEQCKEK
jgi:hypothetical protein